MALSLKFLWIVKTTTEVNVYFNAKALKTPQKKKKRKKFHTLHEDADIYPLALCSSVTPL